MPFLSCFHFIAFLYFLRSRVRVAAENLTASEEFQGRFFPIALRTAVDCLFCETVNFLFNGLAKTIIYSFRKMKTETASSVLCSGNKHVSVSVGASPTSFAQSFSWTTFIFTGRLLENTFRCTKINQQWNQPICFRE